ncbi:Spc98 family-domain-containing protein [Amylostereum chailletii]|nr:Spc98 family-domain-containing protein [Amylostereum chailletii]
MADADIVADELSPLRLQFFVPRLTDKPQDPIMDILNQIPQAAEKRASAQGLRLSGTLPAEVMALTLGTPPFVASSDEGELPTIWSDALRQKARNNSQLRSWDALRPSFSKRTVVSPFLSEQSNRIFASARHYADPHIQEPTLRKICLTEKETLASMQITLIGHSSSAFAWNGMSEAFQPSNVGGDGPVVLSVDGWDDRVVDSYTTRFLTIGTILRRLDLFVETLRARPTSEGPTAHSFPHAISSCVGYYRATLSRSIQNSSFPSMSSALWIEHAEAEQVLLALATLCHREPSLPPSHYPDFFPSPSVLLSDIYRQLEEHIEWSSPRKVAAIFAYILTVTSANYFESLSRSVGYTQDFHSLQTDAQTPLHNLYLGDSFEEEEDEDDSSISSGANDTLFPTFITPAMAETLIRAKKSLKLLRTAQPDHPLLQDARAREEIVWMWTVAKAASSDVSIAPPISPGMSTAEEGEDGDLGSQLDVLEQFKVFDQEPGTQFDTLPSLCGTHSEMERFLDTFPESLPSLTPTLSHLSELVLTPLLDHCHAVSAALISLILSPSSLFHVRTHLVLLRSQMLVTSPIFKQRLGAALFSDDDNWKYEGSQARAIAKRSSSNKSGSASSTWAVGLGLGLSERTSWPPGGTDLSYYLRTVIVDSLELPDHAEEDSSEEDLVKKQIISEAEFRLGFAIRDLPSGSGREKWLNPCCTSLDFLLMNYKAPPPLDVVITPAVLSKYQRIFTFILRLMRVQYAMNTLQRMTRNPSDPLFSTLAPANRQLLQFRFFAHNFIEALASYVFDTAIRGTYDTFLEQLHPQAPNESAAPTFKFSDIFALAEVHSTVLDEVLTACLLRSAQRSAADILRSCMELILDLCILSGELRRRRVEEYEAAPVLQNMFASFRDRMKALVKVLKTLVDKGSASSHLPLEYAYLAAGSTTQIHADGVGNLYRLLVKLDFGSWWERKH